jgi:hypothetical protein
MANLEDGHSAEIDAKKKEFQSETHVFVFSKKHCDLKAQEAIYFKVRDYINAEHHKLMAEELAVNERHQHNENVEKLVAGQIVKVLHHHKLQKSSVLKRIAKDRNEIMSVKKRETSKLVTL